jgi:hypothetical protein
MGMMLLLAFFAVRAVGGMDVLIDKLQALDAPKRHWRTRFHPPLFPKSDQSGCHDYVCGLSCGQLVGDVVSAPGGNWVYCSEILCAKMKKFLAGDTMVQYRSLCHSPLAIV